MSALRSLREALLKLVETRPEWASLAFGRLGPKESQSSTGPGELAAPPKTPIVYGPSGRVDVALPGSKKVSSWAWRKWEPRTLPPTERASPLSSLWALSSR